MKQNINQYKLSRIDLYMNYINDGRYILATMSNYLRRRMNDDESKAVDHIQTAAIDIQRMYRGFWTRRRVQRIWIRLKKFWSGLLQDVVANKLPDPTPFEGTAMAKIMETEAAFELSD